MDNEPTEQIYYFLEEYSEAMKNALPKKKAAKKQFNFPII